MKRTLQIILLLILTGCWSDKPSEQEQIERINNRAAKEISRNIEKLSLLANIEEIEFNKVEIIITEYFKATFNRKSRPKNKEDFENLVKSISEKVNLSQQKVSSVIFSYKYEMRTNEEIGEKYLKELEEASEDAQDQSDRFR